MLPGRLLATLLLVISTTTLFAILQRPPLLCGTTQQYKATNETIDSAARKSINSSAEGVGGLKAENRVKAARNGLPERLITVFGLESSGTTFVHQTFGQAMGLTKISSEDYGNSNGTIRVQHSSLPTGWAPSGASDPIPVLSVGFPVACPPLNQKPNKSRPECQAYKSVVPQASPSRYFINVTSHVLWHLERGVDIQAVLVVRDPGMHFEKTLQAYVSTPEMAYQQYEVGRSLMNQALSELAPNKGTGATSGKSAKPLVVVVSYEALLTLKSSYLFRIYEELDIVSDFIPKFKNGNVKYLPTVPQGIRSKLEKDV